MLQRCSADTPLDLDEIDEVLYTEGFVKKISKLRNLYRFVQLVNWYPIRTKSAQKKWIEGQNSPGARGAATLVGLKLDNILSSLIFFKISKIFSFF